MQRRKTFLEPLEILGIQDLRLPLLPPPRLLRLHALRPRLPLSLLPLLPPLAPLLKRRKPTQRRTCCHCLYLRGRNTPRRWRRRTATTTATKTRRPRSTTKKEARKKTDSTRSRGCWRQQKRRRRTKSPRRRKAKSPKTKTPPRRNETSTREAAETARLRNAEARTKRQAITIATDRTRSDDVRTSRLRLPRELIEAVPGPGTKTETENRPVKSSAKRIRRTRRRSDTTVEQLQPTDQA
mmetsp:Transcript_63354/g.133607  ORF Transcript_63354/g.133607 Transcript_63354/m.133607 type:complete len:239 (+) Transcript_63354:1326-2042(+)